MSAELWTIAPYLTRTIFTLLKASICFATMFHGTLELLSKKHHDPLSQFHSI